MGAAGSGFRVQGGKAILLTAPGAAAIAVVRLVGEGVGEFLARHFSRTVIAGRPVHGTLAEGERVLDDPVIVVSADGKCADVSLHGGTWVVRAVLELARREGFEVVEGTALPLAGEAVDADAELWREVLSYLPVARTELAVRALLAQEEAWASFLRSTPSAESIASVLADRSIYWLLHPPRVAIIGIPNVGKSTLANRLFAQERSISADLPGTTRDWVGEIANVDGLAVMLVDTPGLRETADSIERAAIERAGEQVGGADLVVLVLDPTQPLEGGQAGLLRQFPEALRVMNKADRVATWKCEIDHISTVATTGEGIDRLRDAIRAPFLGANGFVLARPRWWTERQRAILEGLNA